MRSPGMWIGLLIILIAPAVVYWGSDRHARLPEDEQAVWSNPSVVGPGAARAFEGWFYDARQEGFRPAVRPVATLALRLEWSVFHQNRGGFQWGQLALLSLAGLLFWILLLRLHPSRMAATLGALAFEVHPIGAATVLSLAGVSDLLALIFLFLTLLMVGSLLRAAAPSGPRIALAWLFLLLALWSKETAFVGVPLVWVWIGTHLTRRAGPEAGPTSVGRERRLLLLGLGVGAVAALALIQRWVFLSALPEHLQLGKAVTVDSGLGWGRRVALGLVSLPTCGRLLFFPSSLGYVHDYLFAASLPIVRGAFGLAALAGIGWLLVRGIKRAAAWVPWAALALFSLLGAIGITGALGDLAPQKILFQALPGIIGLLVAAVAALRPLVPGRRWALAGTLWFAVLVGFLGARTYLRSGEYSDWSTLVHRQVADIPNSAQGWFDSGNLYLSHREWSAAADDFETALKIRPDFWMAWVNLGAAYFGQTEPGLAMRAFEKALAGVKGKPAFAVVDARANYNRALVLMQQNRNAEAAEALTRMLRIFPDHFAAHANLGMIYSNNEKFDSQALSHLRRAEELETDPERAAVLRDVIQRIQKRRADLNRREEERSAREGSAP